MDHTNGLPQQSLSGISQPLFTAEGIKQFRTKFNLHSLDNLAEGRLGKPELGSSHRVAVILRHLRKTL